MSFEDGAIADLTVDGTTDFTASLFPPPNNYALRSLNVTITLNSNVLPNSSREFIAATIIHEALHAYLSYSQTIVDQHLDMARNYISVFENTLKTMFPSMSEADREALAWGD